MASAIENELICIPSVLRTLWYTHTCQPKQASRIRPCRRIFSSFPFFLYFTFSLSSLSFSPSYRQAPFRVLLSELEYYTSTTTTELVVHWPLLENVCTAANKSTRPLHTLLYSSERVSLLFCFYCCLLSQAQMQTQAQTNKQTHTNKQTNRQTDNALTSYKISQQNKRATCCSVRHHTFPFPSLDLNAIYIIICTLVSLLVCLFQFFCCRLTVVFFLLISNCKQKLTVIKC